MKKIILTSLSFILSFTLTVNAQDCFKYLPGAGTSLETKHYDAKDKETGVSTLTILKRSHVDGGEKLDVRMESTSQETDSVFTTEYSYLCKNGKLYVDMSSYLGSKLDAYKGMQIEVDAENLELPTNPKAGQELPGGTVVASITNNGMPMGKVSVLIKDRKVEKLETIKTPAGSFDCFKIVQKTETKILFMKVKGSSAEWISEGAGVVKSESYNKKGKLVSYSVLSKISK